MPGIHRIKGTTPILRRFVTLSTLSLIAGLCVPLSAQTDTFTAGTGLWSKPSNWSLNQVPGQSNDCVLPTGSVVTSDAAGICLNFTLGGSGTLTDTPGYLDVYGASFTNQGTISVGSGNGIGILSSSGRTTTLSGGGTINFTNSGSRLAGSGNTLVNVDNAIHGMGGIGTGTLAITNQALIDANNPSAPLIVQSNSTGVVNSGTMQASSGGNLQLTAGFLTVPFNNTGGTIQALNGSTVTLAGYTYTGGTLSTTGTGVFQIVPANNTILNNLTNHGTYQLLHAANTTLQGTITNNGTFQALQGGLLINGAVTLKGSGTVTGGTGAFINSFCCNPATLINLETIQGGGNIGDSSLALANQGTIKANNTSSALTLVGAPATNTALMEATGGATLTIENTLNNTGGTIQAQNGSTVLIQNGTISGGTLSTSGSGSFQTLSGMLDGTVNSPTNAGLFTVSGRNNLNLKGTINNAGTIALDPTGGCLALSAPTTLKGLGLVTMAGSSDCIFASSTTDTFTNQSTITGGGSIGDSNPMTVVNQGTIIASQSTPLTIVGAGTGFSNTGKLFVNPGSSMMITGIFKNFASNKLTGGIYSLAGPLSFPNANIVTNSATMTLAGAAAEILDSTTNTNAFQNFAFNKSPLSLMLGQNLSTSAASFSNSSQVTVDATSRFSVAGSYTQTGRSTTVDGKITAPSGFHLNGGSLFGKGTIAASVTATGTAATTVGDSATKPGILSVSSYSQGSTNALNVAIGGTTVGTKYSQLASSNGVSLSGTLNIKRINSFIPAMGGKFTIVTGSVILGQFTTVNGLIINASEKFQVNYNATSVTLTVVP
jgi:hypothetical protein